MKVILNSNILQKQTVLLLIKNVCILSAYLICTYIQIVTSKKCFIFFIKNSLDSFLLC